MLLTAEQVADRIGVTTQTVRRWAGSGQLRAIRFGRVLRFRESDILIRPDYRGSTADRQQAAAQVEARLEAARLGLERDPAYRRAAKA